MVRTKVKLKTLNSFMVCMLCAVFIMSNTYVVRSSELLKTICDVIDTLLLVILLVIILTTSFHTKMFVRVCVLTGYMLVCYLWTGQFDLLRAEIILLALRDTSARKTYRLLFHTFLISLGIVFILYILGVSNAGEMRRGSIALGFGSPNVASKMIQSAVFLWGLWSSNARANYKNVVYLLMLLFVWFTTGSRNSVIILTVFPACLYLFRKIMNSRRGRRLKYLFFAIPPLFAAITIILPQMYGRYPWVQGLNALMSNRIYMNRVALQNYGFTVIGQAANLMDFSGIYDVVSQKYTTFLTIDCFYMYVLTYYGVFGLAIALAAIIAVMRKAWRQNNIVVLTVTVLLCIYSMVETTSSLFCLPSLIYLLLRDDVSVEPEQGGVMA